MKYILIILLFLFIGYIPYRLIIESLMYRWENPFHRVCKKCGAHQMMYESYFGSWWSDVYPIGNNPKCKCHKDTEDRDW